jgi:hypothetical protein
MHDIDRTQAEWEFNGQYEYTDETGLYDESMMEGVFDEAEEMELAAQLLEIQDEAELDQFIGDLFKKVRRVVGRMAKPPIGGMLKNVAKTVLPFVGGALDNAVVPGVDGAMGSQPAAAAGEMFGLELEGMSAEDQEFEVARQFVRFAGDAVKNAAQAAPTTSPQVTARNAIIEAAQQHAPGLLRETGASSGTVSHNGAAALTEQRRSGRWIRRGNQIVLYGI